MTIAVVTVVVVTFFSKNNLTPPKPMRFLRAAFRDIAMFFCGCLQEVREGFNNKKTIESLTAVKPEGGGSAGWWS